MRKRIIIFGLLLIIVVCSVASADTTYVAGGAIQTNTTWNISGSPYVVLGDVAVFGTYQAGPITLTIKPGVKVMFTSGAGLQIGNPDPNYLGGLSAIGTPDSLITFTSTSGLSGNWDGIYFPDASDYGGVASSLRYCVVEKAGQNGWGVSANLYCNTTNQPTMENCIIRDSGGKGMHLIGSSPALTGCTFSGDSIGIYCDNSSPVVHNGSFSNDRDYPLYLTNQSFPDLSGNTYLGNASEAIAVAGGTIQLNGTWHNDNSEPYKILGDVAVFGTYQAGPITLTIKPGVKVMFTSGAGLQIGNPDPNYLGGLSAIGTPDSLITFTSTSGLSGNWDGIYFPDASDYGGAASSLRYCVVEKAGQNGWGVSANLYCNTTNQPTMENCIIRDSGGKGMHLIGSSPALTGCTFSGDSIGIYCDNSSPVVHNGSFSNDRDYPLYLTNQSFPDLSGNTYLGNASEAIAVAGGTIQLNGTWHNDNSEPYKILGDVAVFGTYQAGPITLTIKPGVKVMFTSGAGLQIGNPDPNYLGGLSAIGTPDSLITFTSTSGLSGNWDGIYFPDASDYGGAASSLRYCVVEKAGQNGWGVPANLYCNITNQPTISHCTIRDSYMYGIYLYDSSPSIRNSDIIFNGSYGIYCDGNSHPTIGDTTGLTCGLYGNGGYEIYVNGPAVKNDINARYNFWNKVDSTEIESLIYDHTDNPSKGRVYFIPYIKESVSPTSFVHSLPDTTNTPGFTVTWSGSDDSAGSGLASYNIYKRKDLESFILWKASTLDTSATFTGESGHTYYFYSIARDRAGNVEASPDSFDAKTTVYFSYVGGDPDNGGPIEEFVLSQNYPNPFNPQTVIKYALPHDGEVQIAIYDILGQKVRTLVNEYQSAGYKQVEWDSKNDRGEEVASGIYFYRIKAGEFSQSRKMVILK